MPYLGIEEETLKAQLSHLKSASLDFQNENIHAKQKKPQI